ncbi:MAG: hypothetical protein RR246_00975 [Clostridia bacterium]
MIEIKIKNKMTIGIIKKAQNDNIVRRTFDALKETVSIFECHSSLYIDLSI